MSIERIFYWENYGWITVSGFVGNSVLCTLWSVVPLIANMHISALYATWFIGCKNNVDAVWIVQTIIQDQFYI